MNYLQAYIVDAVQRVWSIHCVNRAEWEAFSKLTDAHAYWLPIDTGSSGKKMSAPWSHFCQCYSIADPRSSVTIYRSVFAIRTRLSNWLFDIDSRSTNRYVSAAPSLIALAHRRSAWSLAAPESGGWKPRCNNVDSADLPGWTMHQLIKLT